LALPGFWPTHPPTCRILEGGVESQSTCQKKISPFSLQMVLEQKKIDSKKHIVGIEPEIPSYKHVNRKTWEQSKAKQVCSATHPPTQ